MPPVGEGSDLTEGSSDHAETLVAILGAGAGSRMGGGKLDRVLGGRPLGMWALSTAQALGASMMFVSPPRAPAWLDPSVLNIEVVPNPDAASGMASSLRLAARVAKDLRAKRLLLILADMPFIGLATLRALLDLTMPNEAVACRYPDGRLGPPACFAAEQFPHLLFLAGDVGARHLLNRQGFAKGIVVEGVELMDIDSVEDLARAERFAQEMFRTVS